VEMHISSSYSYLGMFLQEARDRMYSYPPPYYYGGGWYFATPWLWIDGDKDGSYTYSQWQTKITNRMNIPSPVTITMWGDWFPAQGTGTIYAQFRNDSTEALNGRILFVMTEDSIHISAPNGDQWHNHVARDYLPTFNGEIVSVPAGDSVILSRTFSLQPTWNPDMIQFVSWIQDLNMQPDSTIEIWQGGILNIDELGIEEYGNGAIVQSQIAVFPNPAVNGTKFSFTLPNGETYRINIYDITGRKVKTLSGTASGTDESVEWNLRNEEGMRVSSGVYLYRFESPKTKGTGKIIIR
jgi:hypothetical protein